MGASSSNVPRWKPPAYDVRTGPRPNPVVLAAGSKFLALHEALGDAEPACATDPEKWTGCETPRAAAPAIAGCAGCPALAECAAYAVAIRATVGVWGARYFGRAWAKASTADRTARTDTTTTTEELSA